jgi:hypothetical protein
MGDLSSLGDVRGKRVLVRSDLNVPLDGTTITDDGRIRASVPTISALAEAGARVIVCAHLGRPKGAPEDKYSLAPVVGRLSELLGRPVAFATDTVGESARATVDALGDGDVALLENLRFNAGRPPRSTRSVPSSPTPSPPWPTPTSPMVSGSCTASRHRSTTSPRDCRPPWVASSPPRSTSSSA